MPTKDLLDNSFDERKRFAIGVCWEAINSYRTINLGLCFLLRFWEEYHGQKECI